MGWSFIIGCKGTILCLVGWYGSISALPSPSGGLRIDGSMLLKKKKSEERGRRRRSSRRKWPQRFCAWLRRLKLLDSTTNTAGTVGCISSLSSFALDRAFTIHLESTTAECVGLQEREDTGDVNVSRVKEATC